MKQRINIEQLNELSEEGRARLKAWWLPNMREHDSYVYSLLDPSDGIETISCCEHEIGVSSFPVLSVGQMIEFLDEKANLLNVEIEVDMWYVRLFQFDKPSDSPEYINEIAKRELVDALWEAVKEVLNKKR